MTGCAKPARGRVDGEVRCRSMRVQIGVSLRVLVALVGMARCGYGADERRSWLSCVQGLYLPVVNDMNQATW